MNTIDRASVVALLMALFSASVIFMLVKKIHRDQADILNQRSQFIDLRNQAYKRVESQDYLAANRQNYERIRESVKAGATRRISWIEGLKAAKKELNLPEIQFDIYPMIPIGAVPSDLPFNVGQETIELKLGLLHEGELLMLLDYLRHKIISPFEIISLDMKPVVIKESVDMTIATEVNATEINLEVRCAIRWYSIALAGDDIGQS